MKNEFFAQSELTAGLIKPDRVDCHFACDGIDTDDLAEYYARVPLVPEDVTDRRRDVALREDPRRKLVEQRLEQVMICTVDDSNLDIGALQCPRGKESAEPTANDYYMVAIPCDGAHGATNSGGRSHSFSNFRAAPAGLTVKVVMINPPVPRMTSFL
jgi:hypothetical protein